MPLPSRPLLEPEGGPPYQPFEIHPGVFTARQCDRIVALAEAQGLETARVTDGTVEGDGVDDDGIRRSETTWITPDDASWWIFEKLAKVVERANRRYGFDLSGFGEDLQYTVYRAPGGFYAWHQDGLDGPLATRKLSLVVQLSDPADYVGGELQFFEVYEEYEPEELAAFAAASAARGSVVAFPAFELHRVLPVREGVRRSLVSWVTGPRFR